MSKIKRYGRQVAKSSVDKNSLAYKDSKQAHNFIKSQNRKKPKQKPIKAKDKVEPVESKGENKVRLFLERHSILFEPEKELRGLKNKNNAKLRLDFYLPDTKTAIEFDGRQHFFSSKRFDTTTCTLETRQANDRTKDLYCIKHNIKLIRIPYTEYKNIDSILKAELL